MRGFEEKTEILMHYGENPKKFLGAVVPPIFQNSLFALFEEGEEGGGGYSYSRAANPTVEIVEAKLAQIECAEDACVMASGMSAISSAILHFVKGGDHVVCVRSCYDGAYEFISDYLANFGVTCTFVTGDPEEYENATRENTTLYYLESPSTGIFRVQDIAAIAKIAKARGIHTVIDNTWASPMYQNPIALGVDLCAHSMSKYLGGHSDVVAGCVVGRKADIDSIRRRERVMLGGCLDPHAAWLLLRGMRTLPIRVRQVSENARRVAEFLEQQPAIAKVYWPGLATAQGHEIAEKQMTGYTGLMGVEMPGGTAKRMKFIRALRVFQHGCSWGGFESLITDFGVIFGDRVADHDWNPDLIRLYVGMEDADALIADLKQALAKAEEAD